MSALSFSLKRLHEISDGDAEIERELLAMFLKTADHCLKQIAAGESWQPAIHSLKGAVANLGIDPLYQACLVVEYNEPQGEPRSAFLADIADTMREITEYLAGNG